LTQPTNESNCKHKKQPKTQRTKLANIDPALPINFDGKQSLNSQTFQIRFDTLFELIVLTRKLSCTLTRATIAPSNYAFTSL
jgi:hypothetical protein